MKTDLEGKADVCTNAGERIKAVLGNNYCADCGCPSKVLFLVKSLRESFGSRKTTLVLESLTLSNISN
jgi:hypothetical protein